MSSDAVHVRSVRSLHSFRNHYVPILISIHSDLVISSTLNSAY